MELGKIQLQKELEITEAKLNAIVKVENEELSSRSRSSSSHEGKTRFVEEYVKSHCLNPKADSFLPAEMGES